jgi:hypothetical protein
MFGQQHPTKNATAFLKPAVRSLGRTLAHKKHNISSEPKYGLWFSPERFYILGLAARMTKRLGILYPSVLQRLMSASGQVLVKGPLPRLLENRISGSPVHSEPIQRLIWPQSNQAIVVCRSLSRLSPDVQLLPRHLKPRPPQE